MAEEKVSILLEVIDKGSEELKKFQENLTKTERSVGRFAIGIAKMGAAVGAAAVAALVAMTKASIDTADEIGKAAQKVGITTESFSALAYAAKLSDVSFEGLQGGLKKLAVAITSAQDPTSEMAGAFAALGVKTVDAQGKLRGADEVFADIATRFNNAPDDVSKTAIAMQIFGKAGADLIPLLNGGADGLAEMRAEAEKLGVIYDSQTTKSAEDFNDTLTMLGVGAGSLGLTLAKVLLPTLQVIASAFLEAKKDGSDFSQFAEGVGIIFRSVVKVISTAVATIFAFGKGIGAVGAAIAAVASGDFQGAVDILKMYKDDVDQINTANEEFKIKVDATATAVNKATTAEKAGNEEKLKSIDYRKKSTSAAETEEKQFQKAVVALLKEAESYKQLTAVEQIRIQNTKGGYAKFTEAHKQRLLELAAEVDANRVRDASAKEAITAQQDINKVMLDLAKSNVDANMALDVTKKLGPEAGTAFLQLNAAGKQLDDTIQSLTNSLEQAKAAGESKKVGELTAQLEARQAAMAKFNESGIQIMANQYAAQVNVNRETATWSSLIQGARSGFGELAKQEELVWKWLSEGTISAKEFSLAMQKIDASKMELMKSQVSEFDKKVAGVATTLQSTFGDVFYNIMQGNFKDIGTMFKQMLDKMVAEALAAQLAKALFGDYTRSGSVSGSGGAALTSLVGSLFGMRESGGPVTAGQPYIVGEKRAEVFIPNQSGTIIPDTSSLSMAGGNQVHLSITAMDSQSVIAAIDKVKRPLAEMMNGTNRAYNLGR